MFKKLSLLIILIALAFSANAQSLSREILQARDNVTVEQKANTIFDEVNAVAGSSKINRAMVQHLLLKPSFTSGYFKLLTAPDIVDEVHPELDTNKIYINTMLVDEQGNACIPRVSYLGKESYVISIDPTFNVDENGGTVTYVLNMHNKMSEMMNARANGKLTLIFKLGNSLPVLSLDGALLLRGGNFKGFHGDYIKVVKK